MLALSKRAAVQSPTSGAHNEPGVFRRPNVIALPPTLAGINNAQLLPLAAHGQRLSIAAPRTDRRFARLARTTPF